MHCVFIILSLDTRSMYYIHNFIMGPFIWIVYDIYNFSLDPCNANIDHIETLVRAQTILAYIIYIN